MVTRPITHTVDNRWLMSYAAGLGESHPHYLDTTRTDGVVPHPLFPVCVEWPTVLALRDLDMLTGTVSAEEARRGIHATHDLTIETPMRPGDVVTTTATVLGVQRRSPGAYLTMELVTTAADGTVRSRTRQGSLYLATEVDGPDVPAPDEERLPPLADGATPLAIVERPISAIDAHVYTECARIWNPIHTDRAVALAATLPDIILHGTATLAHGVSAAVEHLAGGDPSRVRRIRGRFAAMVPMPATLTTRVFDNGRFDVLLADGRPAVSNGHVALT